MELFRRKVKRGSKAGQKIGFPTINLNVGNFSDYYRSGVYKCEVIVDNKSYIGALYYGPKLSHKGDTLEVHIINFNGHIYGQFIRIKVSKKIRSPKQFLDLPSLKKQIVIDIKNML